MKDLEKKARLYVIDSQGHKFLFQAGKNLTDTTKEACLNRFMFHAELGDRAADAGLIFRTTKEQLTQNEQIENVMNLLGKVRNYEKKKGKFFGLFYSKLKYNKLLDEYMTQKAKTLSMKPYDDIKQAYIDLSKKYGYKFEQLS